MSRRRRMRSRGFAGSSSIFRNRLRRMKSAAEQVISWF